MHKTFYFLLESKHGAKKLEYAWYRKELSVKSGLILIWEVITLAGLSVAFAGAFSAIESQHRDVVAQG